MTANQRNHLLVWALLLVAGELVLLVLPGRAEVVFLVVAVAFCAGFALRLVGLYPGKPEPLLLDALSGCAAAVAALLASRIPPPFLPLAPPAVTLPHLVYIIARRDIGPSGWARPRSSDGNSRR